MQFFGDNSPQGAFRGLSSNENESSLPLNLHLRKKRWIAWLHLLIFMVKINHGFSWCPQQNIRQLEGFLLGNYSLMPKALFDMWWLLLAGWNTSWIDLRQDGATMSPILQFGVGLCSYTIERTSGLSLSPGQSSAGFQQPSAPLAVGGCTWRTHGSA